MLKAKNLLLVVGLVGGGAHAGLLTNYGDWVVDRRNPAAFANMGPYQSRNDVLKVTVDPAGPTSGHEKYQGRGYTLSSQLPNSYSVLYASAYIPASWLTTTGPATNRDTELWGVIQSSACVAPGCAQWPAVYFDNTRGGGKWYAWNSGTGAESTAAAIPDQWNLVCQALSASKLESYVNGALIHTQTQLSAPAPGATFDRLRGVVINTWNFGTAYDAHWSNIGTGTLTSVAAAGGTGQSAAVGTAFANALVVKAVDAGGNPLPCVPVTFTPPAGSVPSATLSATTVVTDINGEARVTATANDNIGSYAITASAPVIEPATLNLTNLGAAAPTPVPTLDLLSLLGLSGLVATMGVWLRRRRA